MARWEITKSDRIRELLAKGLSPEVIRARTGVKLSEIARVKARAEARAEARQ